MPKKSNLAIKKGDVSLAEYKKFITSLKAKIRSAQIKAAVTVNSELIKLYWEIGKEIFEKQEKGGWGSLILEKAATELQSEERGVRSTLGCVVTQGK